MRNLFWAGLFAAACTAPTAIASPISYTINFTTTAGLAPTAGSFAFDAATNTFTNFVVTWDGLSFDVTGSANGPSTFGAVPSCTGGLGSAAAFALLSGSCAPPPPGVSLGWQADNVTPTAQGFMFLVSHASTLIVPGQPSAPGPIDGQLFFFGAVVADSPNSGAGQWTITATAPTVPEPASFGLIALGLAGIGIFKTRIRRRT